MLNHADIWLTESSVADFAPDVRSEVEERVYSYETIGVDSVRDLVEAANRRPIGADSQLLLVRAQGITLEAQNALLKLLEDPPVTTAIAIVLPKGTTLLDTIRSRVQLHEGGTTNESAAFTEFLSFDVADRMSLIEHKLKAKETDWVHEIKRGLVHHMGMSRPVDLQAAEFVARHLMTREASNKMLLEHLALALDTRS